MPSKIKALALLLAAGMALAGCENTIRGAGQDVQETANAVEDVAQ